MVPSIGERVYESFKAIYEINASITHLVLRIPVVLSLLTPSLTIRI
jgi:hypothetical protein